MRLDDLQFNGLKLWQDPAAFCFGSDAVELANFVPKTGRELTACDLGAGNGILSVLLAAKKNYRVTAVEIQTPAARLCRKNAEYNGLSDKITVVNQAMQDFCVPENRGAFDIAVCNPPYESPASGEPSASEAERIARFETKVTLSEVINAAAHLVKFGGAFYTVHKAQRLAEVLTLCSNARLEPKVLQLLRPSDAKPPHLFLLCCRKNGKPGLRVLGERKVRAEA